MYSPCSTIIARITTGAVRELNREPIRAPKILPPLAASRIGYIYTIVPSELEYAASYKHIPYHGAYMYTIKDIPDPHPLPLNQLRWNL